jgi:DNA-binding IclR family transcriptional regulator
VLKPITEPAQTLRAGTQSLSRGLQLLRMVATRPKIGWRLSDLATACKQEKATVHRILAWLVDERLVVQRAGDRHYLPGPLMFELGLALPDHGEFQRRAEPRVHAFARRMHSICLLQYRSGNEYVCSVRAGTLKLTGLMVYEGTRRPLFTSAGGVAILQTLPVEEARRVLLSNVSQEVARHGTGRLAALQTMRERSDLHGFGVNFGDVVPGSYAFGMPVRNSAGEAFAALCLVGTPELLGKHQLEGLRRELMTTAASLEAEAQLLNI